MCQVTALLFKEMLCFELDETQHDNDPMFPMFALTASSNTENVVAQFFSDKQSIDLHHMFMTNMTTWSEYVCECVCV